MPVHDIEARRIAQVGGAVLLCVLATVATAFALLRHWQVAVGEDRAMPSVQWPADAPGLQSAPQIDLARDKASKREWLSSAGWIDRAQGVAHIPVAAAMEMLSNPGASATTASSASQAASTASGARQ